MPVETPVNGIWDLNASNPLTTDSRRQGDDHLRLIKSAIKLTFPQVNAVINATDEDLNILAGVIAAGLTQAELLYLNGVTSPIQGQIDDPTIMRTDQANTITGGALELDQQVLYLDADNATVERRVQEIRNISDVLQWAINLAAASNPTRPNAYHLYNASSALKLILRQNMQQLEATSTDLLWGGSALALQSAVDLKANLSSFSAAFRTAVGGSGTYDETIAIPGLSTNWQWGITGIKRSDGLSDTISGYAIDSNGFTQLIGNSGFLPGNTAAPAAGNVRVNFTYASGGNKGFDVWLWARGNI